MMILCRTKQATRAWKRTGKEREELPDSSKGVSLHRQHHITCTKEYGMLGWHRQDHLVSTFAAAFLADMNHVCASEVLYGICRSLSRS